MFCPYCGKQLPDTSKFCEYCGQKMDSVDAKPEKKKKKWGWVVALVALAMVVALVLGGVLASCNQNSSWQKQYDLGMRYLSDGDYEEAVIAFLAAIDIDPSRPEAYAGAAEAYVEMDEAEKAIKILKKGIKATGDEDLEELLEELEAELDGEGFAEPVPTAPPEISVTVYLPIRMEKTVYGETTTLWVENYTYDDYGNLVQVESINSNGEVSSVVQYFYDDQGNRIRAESSYSTGSSVYTYVYDSMGKEIQTSRNGETYAYTLDDMGRLSCYWENENTYREYVYAADGMSYRVSEYMDGEMREYTDVYLDENGNIVSTWRYTSDHSLLYRTDYLFDENNHKIQTLCYGFCSADHVGTTYTYYYDEYGNLSQVVFDGDYYSSDSVTVYITGPVRVTESAAARLGQ